MFHATCSVSDEWARSSLKHFSNLWIYGLLWLYNGDVSVFFYFSLFVGKKKTLWLWEFEVLVTFLEANEFISLADLLLIQSYTIHFLAQKRDCLQSLKRIAIWCFCVCVTVVPPIFHWEKEFRMENFICISVKISCFLCWVFYILDGWWK